MHTKARRAARRAAPKKPPVNSQLRHARTRSLAPLFALAVLLPAKSAFAGNAQWLVPTTSDWNTATNWTPNTVPNGPNDIATFISGITTVNLSANTQVLGIIFSSPTQFTINATAGTILTIGSNGVVNLGGAQNFVAGVNGAGGIGAISFTGSGKAGSNVTYTTNGATILGVFGALTSFNNTSTADHATFITNGGAVVNASGGTLTFTGSASADHGTFTTNGGAAFSADGGKTVFNGATSTAANGTFTNNGGAVDGAGGGSTQFLSTSTAGSATFTNNGGAASGSGIGGETIFMAQSTGGSALFINNGGAFSGAAGGSTQFTDSTNAGSATFTNNGATISPASGGTTGFAKAASAGTATISNFGGAAIDANGGGMSFGDQSTAASAMITNFGGAANGAGGAFTQFSDISTAASSTITVNGGTVAGSAGATVNFSDNSTAESATLIANGGTGGGTGGAIQFNDFTTGGTATVKVFGNGSLDISLIRTSLGTPGSITIGSLEGAGNVFLGAANLTVGSNNVSTTFSGIIQDGGASGSPGGSLTKMGSGTLTLTGANTYTGGTTVNEGVLAVAGSGALGSGPTVVNGAGISGGTFGTLDFQQNSNAGSGVFTTNGGAVAGAAGGITQFNNTSSAGGATLVADAGMGGALGGSIQFLDASSGGTARLQVFGNGRLDISAHAAPSVTIGSLEGTGNVFLGSKNLTVGSNNLSTTFSGVIADTGGLSAGTGGSLTKIGTGTLILTGANTYTGATTVNGGLLQVDGSLASANIFVNAPGMLGGMGAIGGSLVNGGLISPGDSPGTLTISHNYTQSPTGTLRIEIAGLGAGQHDLLAIGGTASLAGTLQLVRLNNFQLKIGDHITFLTAAGGITGVFGTVNNDFATGTIISGRVVYGANQAALVSVQESFTKVPELIAQEFPQFRFMSRLTPNENAVAHALDRSVNDPHAAKLIAYLDSRQLPELPGDFDRIAPADLSSIFTIGVALAKVQTSNLQRRTDDLRSGANGFSAESFSLNGASPGYSGVLGAMGPLNPMGPSGPAGSDAKNVFAPAPDNRWGVFLSGTGDWVNVSGDTNARGYDISTGGFTLGVDYKVTPHLAIGLSAGYAGTGADLANGGRVFVNGGQLGLYSTYFNHGFYIDAGVNGGLNGYTTRRAALQGDARGETNGGEFNALFGTGYDWKKGALTFGPTATFNYTDVGIDDFTEHGSLVPLHVRSQDQDSLRTALGFKASYDWKVGSVLIKPELRVAWQHEFGDSAYALDSSFANGAGSVFTVHGPQIGRDSALIGAGFAVQWSDRTSMYLYYDGEIGAANYDSQSVSGGIRIAF